MQFGFMDVRILLGVDVPTEVARRTDDIVVVEERKIDQVINELNQFKMFQKGIW